MPLTTQSCLRISTSDINSFNNSSHHTNNVTKKIVTSNGFEVRNSQTRNIKPLASCLKPRLRIPSKEYPEFKKMMDNLNINKTQKSVRFNIQEPLIDSGSSTSSAYTKSALYDDDTDLVPFEEFESWSLQREAMIKYKERNVPVNQMTSVLTSHEDKVLQPPAENGHYSTPRTPAISTDYAIPKASAKSAHYDIPRTPVIPVHYSVPKRSAEPSYSNTETIRSSTETTK